MTDKLKKAIEEWLSSGADYDTGLKHYVHAVGKGHPTIYILRKKSEANYKLLVKSLCRRASLPEPTNLSWSPDPVPSTSVKTTEPAARPQPSPNKLRADYTFLSEPGTPQELKVLVSNKITAYHNYKAAHAKLFENLPSDQEFANVRDLVENYIENYAIHQELTHYQKTRTILGKHPIFEELKRLKKYRHTSTVELFKQKKRIEHNIWRIRKLMDSGDKPHLRFQRLGKLQSYQLQLSEIEKFLGE